MNILARLDCDSLNTNKIKSIGWIILNLKAKLDGYLDSAHQFIKRAGLSAAAGKSRHTDNIKAI